MGPIVQITQSPTNSKISVCSGLTPKPSEEARILIVCDDDSVTERLSIAFREAGFTWECARSMTAGCASARSGRFPVVFTTPVLRDGSWRRLVEIASQYDLGFEVVLAASTFDPNHWAGAREDGAFDVLDALHELPRAAEVAKCALWAAYLKGAGPSPQVARPSKAA
jgi:DNA-binding NtrC family response regulator